MIAYLECFFLFKVFLLRCFFKGFSFMVCSIFACDPTSKLYVRCALLKEQRFSVICIC